MTHTLTYHIHEVEPYINWLYFFHAWGFAPRFSGIATLHGCDACRASWLASFPESERGKASEAMQLHKDALRMLRTLDTDFHTRALFGLFSAGSDGDDLLLRNDDKPHRIPLLRSQTPHRELGVCLCLTDFVHPLHEGTYTDTVGAFVCAAQPEMEHLYEEGPHADPFKHLLAQTLADRLAEATAEKMHEDVRRLYWGYAPDEHFDPAELHREAFQGIRPSVGYPSLPDQSTNFELDALLHFDHIGVHLTENGAMQPHAAVSGLLLAHPQARHFAVGPIDADQLADYAHRKQMPLERVRRFLAANLLNTNP